MREDGFEFLELFGNIDEEYIYQAMQPWEGQTRKYALYHMSKKVDCLLIIMMLGFCAVFHNQVYAAISRFTTLIGEVLGLSDDLTPYTDLIQTTQRQDGTEVTLREVIWTGNSLLASVSVKGIENDDSAGVSAQESVEINGQEKVCNSTRVFCSGDFEETGSNYVIEWNYGSSLQIKGKADIKIKIVVHRNMEDMEGQTFEFAFSASKEELQENTVHMELNQKLEIDDKEAVLKGLSLNSVVSSIQLECEELPIDEKQYYLKVTDKSGSEFCYSMVKVEDRVYTFQNNDHLPSSENEWLEVQMYVLAYEKEENTEELVQPEEELSKVFQVNYEKMKPVSQKIRITVKK